MPIKGCYLNVTLNHIVTFIKQRDTNIRNVHVRLVDWLTVHRSITLVDFQLYSQSFYLFIYTGSAQICIHTLTKENSMLNISTKFNYT